MTCWCDMRPGDVTIDDEGDAFMVIAIEQDSKDPENYVRVVEMIIWMTSTYQYSSRFLKLTWMRDQPISGKRIMLGGDA